MNYKSDVFSDVYTLAHEAGHSMYERNLPRALAFQPGGMARGMTAHESQSLSIEKVTVSW